MIQLMQTGIARRLKMQLSDPRSEYRYDLTSPGAVTSKTECRSEI